MSVVATGLRIGLLTSGQGLEVAHVAPGLAHVTAARDDLAPQYLPPTASRQWQWTPILWRQWSRAPRAPRAGALLQGGGGVALWLTSRLPVPSNPHRCYLYIFMYEYMYMQVLPAPPPRHGHFERHVHGVIPPPTLQSLQWT